MTYWLYRLIGVYAIVFILYSECGFIFFLIYGFLVVVGGGLIF